MTETALALLQASDYDPAVIEPKWQQAWRDANAFQTPPEPVEGREDVHVLNSHPFTSGAAHMGHVRSYSIGDAHARFRRARGDSVLYSLGFDAFGLPAELSAIEHERHAARVGRQLRRADARAVRRDGLLLRLVAHLHELRRGHLPLVAVAVPRAARGRLHRRARGLGRLVRELQDGARPRAGRGRPVLALPPAGTARAALAVVRARERLRGGERPPPGGADRLEQGRDRRAARRARPRGRRGAGREDARRPRCSRSSRPMRTRSRRPSSRSLSPNHPEIDRWTAAEGVREQLAGLRDAGWQRDDRKLKQRRRRPDEPLRLRPRDHPPAARAHLALGRRALRADRGARHPVRGPDRRGDLREARTAHDRGSCATAASGARKTTQLATREAKRFRAADFPITRQRAWGGPTPIVHCDACGTVPVPLDQLPFASRRTSSSRRGQRAARPARLPRHRVPGVRRARAARDGHARLPLRRRLAAVPAPGPTADRGARCSPTPSSSAGSRSTSTSTVPTPAASSSISARRRRCCAISATSPGCPTASATGGPTRTRWSSSTGAR